MPRTTKKQSPASYGDVKYVMEMAVKKPGLIFETMTPGQAIRFKQRCNQYRNLLRDIAAEQVSGVPGYRAETAFDLLVIRQVDQQGNPSRAGRRLRFDHEAPQGRLLDPETGEEIELNLPTTIIDDRGGRE